LARFRSVLARTSVLQLLARRKDIWSGKAQRSLRKKRFRPRDLRLAKWRSGVSLRGSNPEPLMSALCQKRTSQSLNRSPRWQRCVGDYSREDAKSCNAISAKRFSARHQYGRSGQRRVQFVGLDRDIYGTVFGHTASYINKLTRSQIFPLRG